MNSDYRSTLKAETELAGIRILLWFVGFVVALCYALNVPGWGELLALAIVLGIPALFIATALLGG